MRHRVPFRRISIHDIDTILTRHDITVVDVRDAGSYLKSHIGRAQHVSHANVATLLGALRKGAPVVIYCYHGHASQEYAQMFSDFGFTEVYSLDGGFDAWRSMPGATVTPPGG
jgi:thiosulfate/3-mercaptopyruvate sulfurtransferase